MSEPEFRRAVITGGSSGIGFAIAQLLVRKGTNVLLIARNREKLEASAARLRDCGSSAAVQILALDITDRTQVATLLTPVCSGEEGIPDLLVNCAGMAYPDYFQKIPSDIFDRTIKTNLSGTWNVLQAIVPNMKRGSQIVNVSSVAGLVGTFGYTAYAASKFGIIGLSEALRNELSLKGIRVSVLCPPDTDTPQLEMENRTKPPETKAISGNAGILSAGQVAKAMMRGLKRKKFIIIPGFQGKMIYILKRLVPGIVFLSIDKTAKKT